MTGLGGRGLAGSLTAAVLVAASIAAPASGAIKVQREDNVLAKFRKVECLMKDGRPVGFLARGRANGWAFVAKIYARNVKYEHIYDVEYGDDSRADVFVFPPKGPAFTNMNEPRPGGEDLLGDAGSVALTKKRGKQFGVGLPLIYDGAQNNPPPKDVTVSGLADC
jgi:hypothetical protein